MNESMILMFDNADSVVMQTQNYVHCYEDMDILYGDIKAFIRDGNSTDGWDGNDFECAPSFEERCEYDLVLTLNELLSVAGKTDDEIGEMEVEQRGIDRKIVELTGAKERKLFKLFGALIDD